MQAVFSFLTVVLSLEGLLASAFQLRFQGGSFQRSQPLRRASHLSSLDLYGPETIQTQRLETVHEWLDSNNVDPKLRKVVNGILEAVKLISYKVRTASCDKTACFNELGDNQLAIDVLANDILMANLASSGVVAVASSEEEPVEKRMGGNDYSVAFDPLDGSSIVDADFAVGTIFGIWPSQQLRGVTGREMSAAGMAVYGPRTMVTLAIDGVPGAHEFTLRDDLSGQHGYFVHSNEIAALEEGKLFSPGNLRATQDNKGYKSLVDFWMQNKYTLRYTGGFVPDVNQLLVKGRGVFVTPSSPQFPSKLKLLYEAAPLAYVIEKAGGASSNGLFSLLDLPVSGGLNDKTQVAMGSKEEVKRFNMLVGPERDGMNKKVTVGGDVVKSAEAEEELQLNVATKSSNAEGGIKLMLAAPRGFCEGVTRAIDTVEAAIKIWGAPVYVKHEIVHNQIVCDRLREKGAIFIEDLADVPEGAKVIYSAHGIPPEVRQQAADRQLYEVDATCPLVTKVHVYVKKAAAKGENIVLIGHKKHVEIQGVVAEAPEQTTVLETPEDVDKLPFGPDDKIFYATQTTLSMDDCAEILGALLKKFPQSKTIPSGSICYATTNRQNALKAFVEDVSCWLKGFFPPCPSPSVCIFHLHAYSLILHPSFCGKV